MNNKGFTVVELLASFALTMIIMVFLFEIVLQLKEVYVTNTLKTRILDKNAIVATTLNEKLSDTTSVNCFDYGSCTFGSGSDFIKINESEKSIEIGGETIKYPDSVDSLDADFETEYLDISERETSILKIKYSIKSGYLNEPVAFNYVRTFISKKRVNIYVGGNNADDENGTGSSERSFSSIEKALRSASNNTPTTINLLSNFNVNENIVIDAGKIVTIKASDLGKTLYLGDDNYILNNGKLTLSNITIEPDINANLTHSMIINRGDLFITENTTLANSDISSIHDQGAAITNHKNMTMSGGTITGNTAWDGGAILNLANLEITGGTITNNVAISGGGGIMSYAKNINNPPTISIKGATISNNTAAHGGGIYNGYSSGQYQTAKLTIDSDTIISGNKATGSGDTTGQGGGVYNFGELIMKGGTISNNTSVHNGAGICTIGNMTMENGTISNNIANDGVDGNSDGGGIAIVKVYNAPTVTLKGGTISGNKADYGGGIINGDSSAGADASTLNISGVIIDNNTATVGSGGGIYSGATINITNGEISSNKAQTYGGGFMCKSTCTMSGGTITGNKAITYSSGGVGVDGTFTMSGGEISSNKALNGEGGGLLISAYHTFKLTGGTIKKNNAKYNGGISKPEKGNYTRVSGYVCKNNSPRNSYDITEVDDSHCS